jgi:putative MATE family efflux protein
MRHIWVMTTTSAIGLMGIFLVDFIDMLFLSMLESADILAGVGFAGSISFFTVSLSIGITISMAALVSRMIGQRNIEQAKRYVINVVVLALTLTSTLALVIWFNLPFFFRLLGADDAALTIGVDYLKIVLPSLPILAMGMAMSGALRAIGDAKLSMYTTLLGGLVNAILDPIFIFSLSMGVEGAAIASVFARFTIFFIALYGVTRKHHMLTRFSYRHFINDLRPIFNIAGPAMLTNIATPVGNAIVIASIAKFGAAYVAAFAIISRTIPLAFGLVFSLSGAIAPIYGQNYGAKYFDRVQQVLINALQFNAIYVVLVSILLFLLQNPLIAMFNLKHEAAELMQLFCTWIAITFIFNGAQFIANSTFNNLGKPVYATWFNVGKSTLGTLPFVVVGGHLAGASGVLIGQAVGGALFAVVGIVAARRLTLQIEK